MTGILDRWTRRREPPPIGDLPDRVREVAQPFDTIDDADLSDVVERVAGARLVLIGEASHGTAEFYRMRARISRELIERHGFGFVAVEADWPDAARIDAHVRGAPDAPDAARQAFARFPTWMWRNAEVLEFVDWLRDHNEALPPGRSATGFYGLDLYSLYESIEEVLRYLDDTDPDLARVARERYGCLSPYQDDPVLYGMSSYDARFGECEEAVTAVLRELQQARGEARTGTGDSLFDAVQNARVASNAERYYRAMYYGGAESWNLRDEHMFETLQAILAFHGPDARGIVWAHNSHLGDASATEMATRGELNLGQLVREHYRNDARLIGFATHAGTVFAADRWGEPGHVKQVRPSEEGSYERVCHETGVERFILPLRPEGGSDSELIYRLTVPRLQRAIGVIYRPDTEIASHYFSAELPRQFDEYIWFDESSALQPIGRDPGEAPGPPEGHPLATLDV